MAEQQTAHFKNTYCTTTIAFYDLVILFRRLETVPPPIVVILSIWLLGNSFGNSYTEFFKLVFFYILYIFDNDSDFLI